MHTEINLYDGRKTTIDESVLQKVNVVLDKAEKETDNLRKIVTDKNIAFLSFTVGKLTRNIYESDEYQTIINNMSIPAAFLDGSFHPLRTLGYHILGELYANIPSVDKSQKTTFKDTANYFKDAFIIQTALISEILKEEKDAEYIQQLKQECGRYARLFNNAITKQTLTCEELSDTLKILNDEPEMFRNN